MAGIYIPDIEFPPYPWTEMVILVIEKNGNAYYTKAETLEIKNVKWMWVDGNTTYDPIKQINVTRLQKKNENGIEHEYLPYRREDGVLGFYCADNGQFIEANSCLE